jgi:endonuclease/exonuclease/phosphatase family metal-dependent hydrolase
MMKCQSSELSLALDQRIMERMDSTSLSRRGLLRAAGLAAAAMAAGCTHAARPTTSALAPSAVNRRHRILSCNILFDLPEQKGTPFDWAAGRREVCLNRIRAQQPDIVGMQEVGRGQNDDFLRAFPDYVVFGYDDPYVDRRPKRFQNIKNVILFSRRRYDLVSAGQYWLSQTPLLPGSRDPGEGLPRHVTWVRLRDRASGRQFRVLDTHWDLKQPLRLSQAAMIAADTQPYSADFPQLLCGDFNSDSASAEHRLLQDAGWRDTYAELHANTTQPATSPATTVGMRPKPAHRIDYIYFRGAVRPVATRMISANALPHPASDHNFVMADVEI